VAECSICKSAEAASIINELLEKKTGLDAIAQQTGFHRSSIHRHSKRCYPTWRAARLKARKGNATDSGRLLALWPDGNYTYFGETIPASSVRTSDEILVVEYAPPAEIHTAKNPAALLTDSVVEEAYTEDAQRTEGLNAHPE
jgi:hypothetical protein